MKRVKKQVFFIVALLIVALSVTSFFGIYAEYGDNDIVYIKGAGDIRWGVDIQGGVEATFYPVDDSKEQIDATNEQIDAAEAIISIRLVNNHITDYELYKDYDNDRIIVRFPWQSGETNFAPEEAIQEISVTAMLTFREGHEYESVKDELGTEIGIKPSGVTEENIILNGDQVTSAEVMLNTEDSEYVVLLKLDESGKESFANATEKLAAEKGTISIWLDDTMISYPTVSTKIADGEATISGSFTLESATDLADKINAGALPFKLATASSSSISPKLGSSALEAMLFAGIIALAIIMIFMIGYYRLPGVVSSIALLGQVGGIIACVSGYLPNISSFTMTIPGIAGMILAIGMGVDANIITNERIREEIKAGRTIDGAVSIGLKNSFSAIFDGNITNVIVAVILMGVFGPPEGFWAKLLTPFLFMFDTTTTGAIYSFGYTLLIGVILNFIMGVVASRLMMQSVCNFKVFRNRKLFGGEAE